MPLWRNCKSRSSCGGEKKTNFQLVSFVAHKGIRTGVFHDTLAAMLGPNCHGVFGLSATTVARLKSIWKQDSCEWPFNVFGCPEENFRGVIQKAVLFPKTVSESASAGVYLNRRH
jgi:hypothetical protein